MHRERQSEGGKIRAVEVVQYPHRQSKEVVRYSAVSNGKARFRCQQSESCGRTSLGSQVPQIVQAVPGEPAVAWETESARTFARSSRRMLYYGYGSISSHLGHERAGLVATLRHSLARTGIARVMIGTASHADTTHNASVSACGVIVLVRYTSGWYRFSWLNTGVELSRLEVEIAVTSAEV
jgi:hypothetical protein